MFKECPCCRATNLSLAPRLFAIDYTCGSCGRSFRASEDGARIATTETNEAFLDQKIQEANDVLPPTKILFINDTGTQVVIR